MTFRSLFTLIHPSNSEKYGPRTGRIEIDRQDGTSIVTVDTPALLTATSRGLVPHLSRDNVHLTQAIQHLQLPFESFLERTPPVPTLVEGTQPLHTFLGLDLNRHVVIMTLRDPLDGRKMPPNGNDFVSAHCMRGVRKVSTSSWNSYVSKCKPDLVVALSDTPFTPAPHSQKRLTKSIERSIAWIADILKLEQPTDVRPVNVLVHLAGGIETDARSEFAERLSEPVEQKDAAVLSPLNTLDEGVAGYIFDLEPLRISLAAQAARTENPVHEPSDLKRSSSETTISLIRLFHASLDPLPANKPRVLNSPTSPHEILRLVRDVGVDLVDASWAQHAAQIGIALDFRFPVTPTNLSEGAPNVPPPHTRASGRLDLGHNLFDPLYRHDHSRLAACFLDGHSASSPTEEVDELPVCECAACSPRSPASRLQHSSVDSQAWADVPPSALQPPYVRAYLHHLLHTHEMSAHALLAMHNLTTFSAFLAGIRAVAARGDSEAFAQEVARFEAAYDEDMELWGEAEGMWREVDRARGKGRLAREREKQAAAEAATSSARDV